MRLTYVSVLLTAQGNPNPDHHLLLPSEWRSMQCIGYFTRIIAHWPTGKNAILVGHLQLNRCSGIQIKIVISDEQAQDLSQRNQLEIEHL
jgi:hypothetical protein